MVQHNFYNALAHWILPAWCGTSYTYYDAASNSCCNGERDLVGESNNTAILHLMKELISEIRFFRVVKN